MDQQTPRKLMNTVSIPASPFMKKLGFGTGIAVYELQRSPLASIIRSPWAVKKLLKRKNMDTSEKMLNQRLQSEASILRKLNHPNIVGFRAFTKDKEGSNILAMEECTTCLGDLIEERSENTNEPYPANTIHKVSFDISKALNYLHNEALVLHCDIKSYNILINGNFDICKLCDFGICLPLNKDGELNKEKAGENAEYTGTGCWCAPEVLKYPQKISTKADIYSFGLVIWEMIALQPPVDKDFKDKFSDSSFIVDCLTDDEEDRLRPDLPDIDFDMEYNPLLELYHCCTDVEPTKRPNAANLFYFLGSIEKSFT